MINAAGFDINDKALFHVAACACNFVSQEKVE